MSLIDEWTPLVIQSGEARKSPPVAASAAARGAPPKLPGGIYQQLMALKPRAPMAVHFYLGEGLRWIRVGFDGDAPPLGPDDVVKVGQAINDGMKGSSEALYFHALRPNDLLFFLEGGKEESMGMPASYFGAPLGDVLKAWGLAAPAPARKTASRRTARG